MTTTGAVKPGQIWIHVGGDGIRGRGLLVRIREVHDTHFIADYPPATSPRRYSGWTLGPYYQLLSPAEARKHLLA